jgi:tetratricopeptide (TPR) repeat protein
MARAADEPRKALDILKVMTERYPDDEDAHLWVPSIYQHELGDIAKSLEAAEAAVKALPKSGPLRNQYGYSLLRVGRFPEALKEFEEYAALAPREPNPHDSMAEAYVLMGQPERAVERYGRVLEMEPTFFNAHVGRAYALGMMGRYDDALREAMECQRAMERMQAPQGPVHFFLGVLLSRVGRYEAAGRALTSARAAAAEVADHELEVAIHLLDAHIQFDRGHSAAALATLERAIAPLKSIDIAGARQGLTLAVNAVTGTVAARLGKTDEAENHLANVDRDIRPGLPDQSWLRQLLAGEIAAARGRYEEASDILAMGLPRIKMPFTVGLHFSFTLGLQFAYPDAIARLRERAGDLDGAITAYRNLLTPDVANPWTLLLEPRYILALARLYAKQGDETAARREYQRFLDLWKDADAGEPELAEARRALR